MNTNNNRQIFRNALMYIMIFVAIVGLVSWFNQGSNGQTTEVSYTQFVQELKKGDIKEIKMQYANSVYTITGEYKEAKENTNTTSKGLAVFDKRSSKTSNFKTTVLPNDGTVTEINNAAQQAGTQITTLPESQSGVWLSLFLQVVIPIAIFGFLMYNVFSSQMGQGGPRGVMNFGRSKATDQKQKVKVRFSDVAGAEEEKQELVEVVEFLKDPRKFIDLGARIPAGVLLEGPPGTGKTLLAKAVAGEANVPFFSISGSEFVEMFVGVGASRVRDLFENAKKNAPAIIFIDEIDAVGRQRGTGMGGGHDEREQTLNQLLVEMDGFGANEGIITLAATNRPDILDPALLRPGRFDRQVVVGRPDLHGREAILKVHARNKPLADDVDLKTIAKKTPGFTGADLSNLLNEAALLAARLNKKVITMAELEEASEKVSMGPERRSHIVSEKDRKLTAYHESGHAIVAHLLPHANPVHKVTIIPRGYAGGYTMMLPKEEHDYKTKAQLLADIRVALGGRIAEALVLGDISTGASGDLQSVTNTARSMVTRWGMSDTLGPIVFGEQQEQVFLGKNIGHERNYSEEVASKIDVEIHHIVDEAYRDVEQLLTDNMDFLHNMAKALLEEETIDAKAVENLHKYGTTKAPDETEAPTASHMDAVISMPNATEETKTSSTESDVQS